MRTLQTIFLITSSIVLGFYFLLVVIYLFLLFASIYTARKQPRRARLMLSKLLLQSSTTPPVTILVPAHNEQTTVAETVRSLQALRYPKLEVIVINDGSSDGTMDELIRSFSLRPADIVYHPLLPTETIRGVYLSMEHRSLIVIDKVRGGKSDALNAGINLCRTPWVCSVDADSILEEDALLRVMRPAIDDNTVVGSSGIVRIANGCQVAGGRVLRVALPSEKLAVFQVIEYLHSFLQGRVGWSWMNSLMIISGAFGIFQTEVLREVGGYSRRTVAEDMELVVRIHRYHRDRQQPYQVVFVPDPVCWTEVPTRVAGLLRQRRRWHRGLAEVLMLHRDLFFRPRMGLIGFLVLPYFALELVAPLVELFGYISVPLAWALGWLSRETFVVYLVLAFLLGTALALWAVLLEEFTYRRYPSWRELFRLVMFALTEHVGYHQIVLLGHLQGIYEYLRGRRQWGEQERMGFTPPPPIPPKTSPHATS